MSKACNSNGVANILVHYIKAKRGRLTKIREVCGINSSEFSEEGLTTMSAYRRDRIYFALIDDMTPAERKKMMGELDEWVVTNMDQMYD
jgi:hypothetical protein